MANPTIVRDIEGRLRLGDHLCSFYEDRKQQFQIVIPFIKDGLRKREKCLYVVDENTAAEISAGLLMHGISVQHYLERSQLSIVTSRESYLRLGRFDANAMISFISSALEEALGQGYSGLRGAGEMSWILRDLDSLDDFFRYEERLSTAFRRLPVKLLCQYNTKKFFGNILMQVLKTHPRVLLGLDLYENPFCEHLAEVD